MATDTPTPARLTSVFALATDDIMHFARGSQRDSVRQAARLDAAFNHCGIIKHPAKDITGELNGKCVGIDLEDGLYWAPHKPKLGTLLTGLLQIATEPALSPLGTGV